MTEEIQEGDWEEITEEIDTQEVEAMVVALNELIEKAKSETIKSYLEVACEDIANLVEWEEENEGNTQAEAA